jgi:hypothetical protein
MSVLHLVVTQGLSNAHWTRYWVVKHLIRILWFVLLTVVRQRKWNYCILIRRDFHTLSASSVRGVILANLNPENCARFIIWNLDGRSYLSIWLRKEENREILHRDDLSQGLGHLVAFNQVSGVLECRVLDASNTSWHSTRCLLCSSVGF